MSYNDGLAALNLQMTDRVPRTEYSASFHWELVNKVIGSNIHANSPKDLQDKASTKFKKAWNYDIAWSILYHNQIFGDHYTKMGHAEYASEGSDYSSEVSSPFTSYKDVLNMDFKNTYAAPPHSTLVKECNIHFEEQKHLNPNSVAMTGIYVTLVSGLLEVFGWDHLLLAAGMDQDGFGEVTNRYADFILPRFEALADCDSDVIMVHDDIVWTSGPFISPEWYRKYIFPNYKKMFAPLQETGKKIIYTSDGNYNAFIDDIADVGVNGFVLEPTTDLAYIAEKYGKTHSFIGNADTRILLSGTKDEIYNEVKRCMDIGKKYPGFFMAVGNHIPSNTPIENALFYNEVYEELSRR